MTKEQILDFFARNPLAEKAAIVVGVFVVAVIAYFIAKRIVLRVVMAVVQRTTNDWDDVFVERGVFNALAWVAPALVAYYSAYLFSSEAEGITQRLLFAYIIAVLMTVVGRTLDAANIIYNRTERAKELPIKGYIQIAKLLMVLIGGIVIFATVLNRSPWGILSGLGAATAVLLLVFRDTILSFVASIQLATNDMVRIGDWVSMPQYGADGDVVDVALHVVKIQNWDKTITTIPTKAFIEQAFKNWRGMTESGGRRIKRSVAIDASSVRFLDDDMFARLSKIQFLEEYLDERKKLVDEFNAEHEVDTSNPVNGRRLTNLGTFRAYVTKYLEQNPNLRDDMTFLVRQLAPSAEGVPIEIYVFTSDIRWAYYEGIQADIFDHLLAVLPEFDLRIFQQPTGHDFSRLNARQSA